MSAGSGPGVFVGRRREFAAVTAALRTSPALVLVEGEAGIGKSRLVREVVASTGADRTVLELHCPPVAEAFPLGPVVDGLHALGLDPGAMSLTPLAGALRPLFPEWAERLPPAPEALYDPHAIRHRLLRAVIELISGAAVDLIIVEDLHWADPATVDLLLQLTAAPEPSVDLLLTLRPAEVEAGAPLRRLGSRATGAAKPLRVELVPFDVAETGELVAGIVDADGVSTELASFLHERTDGVPLAVEESVSLLRERGDIYRSGDRWERRMLSELQVPPTVRDSVLERVDRLEPGARRVVEAAAVLREPVDEPTVAVVAETDDSATRIGLATALTSGLLVEDEPGRFRCRHILTARAVEEALPASERRRLHRQAATALTTADPPPVARLSRHFREAGDVEQWCRYAELAAGLAREAGDDLTAVRLLLEPVGDARLAPDRRVAMARLLGEAAAWGRAALGDLGPRVAEALTSVLGEAGVPRDERGAIRLLLGRLHLQLGEFETAADDIEAAVPDLDRRPDLAAHAMIALALPRGNDWPVPRHRAWLERAETLAARLPTPQERTRLAVDRVSVLLMTGDPTGWSAADRLEGGAGEAPERQQVARGLMNVGHLAIGWGRYGTAADRLDAAVELMGETGYGRLLNSARLTQAHLDWQTGRWAGLAERIDALAASEQTLPEAGLEAALLLGLLAVATGDRDDGRRRLERVLREVTRRDFVDAQASPAAALARLHLEEGETAQALAVAEPVVDLIARKGVWIWATDVLPVLVDALGSLGWAEEAARWCRRFGAGLGTTPAPAAHAALAHCRASAAEAAGDDRAAADLFGQARSAWAVLPRPYAELIMAERRILAATRVGEDAVAGLDEVQRGLVGLGARRDADRVARLMRRHGLEVARTWRGGRRGYGDRLSPREIEVVRLVARGLTSRGAADELYLSPRTVDRHLASAMRKLDVSSRAALTVAAHGAGLLTDRLSGDGASGSKVG